MIVRVLGRLGRLCGVVVLLAGARELPAQGADTTGRLGMDPAVRTATLPNGLRYYIRANRQPERRAELRLVVNAGSVLEDGDQRGLAHFVEHMAFNGTTRFPKQALVDFIEGLGMRFGAHLNASTSFDETIYELQVPTDSAGILSLAFDILDDWAQGVRFDPQEVQRERGVVIEEWRLGLGAQSRIFNRQLPVLFQGSRYAERLPIGDRRTLETFSRDALLRFYHDWYRPDLMAVIAVGDFDVDSVEVLIRDRFTGLRNPASPRPRPVTPVPPADTALVAVATDPEATGSRATMAWRIPPRDEGTVASYRAGLVERLRDQMLNDRLAELTTRADPPFIGAGAGRSGFVRGVPAYSLGVAVADGGLEQGLLAALTEAERASRFGFTATEFERAGQDMVRGYERAWAERDKTSSPAYVGEYVRHFLEGEPSPGIETEYALVRELLPGITLDEVSALARQVRTERGQVLLVSAPEKPGLAPPDGGALLALSRTVREAALTAYDDAVTDAALVPTRPAPRAIVSQQVDPRLGTIEWTLAGGTRVIVRPTDFKADEVLFTAYSPGGSSLASDEGYLSSALATTLVGLGGLGTFDAVALDKKLSGKVARATPYLTATQEGLSGGASPRDLETLFELIYLTFTAPRADTTAFRAFVTNARASIVNRGANPEAVFGDTLQAILTQHHPRTRPVTPGAIDSLNLGTAYRFYQDRFADASDFTFVFVGNIVPDSLRPLVERWIGGLPALLRKEQWRDLGIVPPRGVIERTVRKGVEARSTTRLVFTGPLEYSRANRAALRGLAEVLNIRLREQLREALGGTYGVEVQASPVRWPRPSYSVSIGFGSAPERADELVLATLAQIDSVRVSGPTATELAKVREAEIRNRETALRQNRYWLGQLAFHDQTGEDPMALLDARGDAEYFTADAIRDAARRYLDPANYVRVTLLPESKATP
jgi:zinc protease